MTMWAIAGKRRADGPGAIRLLDFEAGESGVDEDGVVAAQAQRARDGVEVEPAYLGVQLVLDGHPLGVAREQVRGRVARSWVISRVGSSRQMLRMAIWRALAVTSVSLIMYSRSCGRR
jgi:hypothetical protein